MDRRRPLSEEERKGGCRRVGGGEEGVRVACCASWQEFDVEGARCEPQ